MKLPRPLAAPLLTIIVMLTTISPAVAATETRTDPSGDAAARFDIVRATYTNNGAALTARIKVRDLDRRAGMRANQLRMTFSTAPMRRDNAQFEMYAKRRAQGDSRKLWLRQGGQWTQIRCRNLSVRWDAVADVITARVPMVCLGEGYGTQRIYSSLTTPNGLVQDTATRTFVAYK